MTREEEEEEEAAQKVNMRSYEVRGRTGRAVRKKSKRGEEGGGAERLGSRYDES